MITKFEFIKVEGRPRESGIGRYDVSINDLNAMGQEGWQVAYVIANGHVVVMQRQIPDYHDTHTVG